MFVYDIHCIVCMVLLEQIIRQLTLSNVLIFSLSISFEFFMQWC